MSRRRKADLDLDPTSERPTGSFPRQALTAGRRRPTGVLLSGVAAAILVGAVVGGDGEPSTRDDLARRIRAAPEPTLFGFTYRRGGTRVLDCVLPDTSFSADVDLGLGRMVVRTSGPDGEPTILVTPEALFLHRSLFADPPFATAWLRSPRPAGDGAAVHLRRILGSELARDVLGDRLPAGGQAIAAEAVAVAASVARTGTVTIAGAPAEGFRIEVDPSRFRAAATTGNEQARADEPIPVFEAWVDGRGRVVRLGVSARRSDGSPGPPEDGWTIDYRPVANVSFPTPRPSDVTDDSALDTSRLAPAPKECRLPS